MKIRRTTLTAAATLVALSAVAACNDGVDAKSAPPAVSAPATASPAVNASASASASPSPSGTTEAPTPTATPTATATPTPPPTPTATGAPVDATGAFDPAVALANADRTPYAATETMKTTASADGQGSVITATGRVNFNTPSREGRTETKMTITGSDEPMFWLEVVNTGSAVFMRDKSKPGGAWSPSTTADDTRSDTIGDYVKALVDAGPAARKGMEQKNGVPAYHLGARMTAAQMKTIDPKEYQKLVDKGVSGKQIDVWIDRAGRVLAQTQSMKIPKDGTTVSTVITVAYTDFGPRETFPAPTTAAAS
ncbi:hypothetical protein SAMN05216371_8051 [Streptomyces sp. TLI_053]|uniref:hypothetical protein n=1 Tax=Streptomyces sp. TLI_053 TaxID=1855352 RepID=UPI00087C1135|nr:hypothetical protein [Streptomyces sp. TLI_053]SDT83235.1 hypothetical protein SAMN05216371_8051 [Streptomyces sp. TLI_053]